MGFFQKHKQLKIWLTAFVFVALIIVFEKLLAGLPAVLGVIGKVFSILTPFIAGFAIAFVLYIPSSKLEGLFNKAKFLQKKKIARILALIITYIVFIAAISLLISYILPMVLVKLYNFIINDLPVYYNRINAFVDRVTVDGKIFGIAVDKVTPFLDYDWLLSHIDVNFLTSVSQGIFKFGSTVVDFFLALVSSIYMLASREALSRVVKKFFSLFFKDLTLKSVNSYLGRIGKIFYNYIYSQVIDAFLVAILLSIAFSIVGIQYPVLFGVLIGICNLIPYFGAIISGACVTLITLLSDGPIKAIIILALILVIQQIDSNILQPKIVGDKVGVHPLFILIAITVGWGLFGFIGILIGVPIMATIKMILNDIYSWHEAKKERIDI